jgi:hypothetical protein
MFPRVSNRSLSALITQQQCRQFGDVLATRRSSSVATTFAVSASASVSREILLQFVRKRSAISKSTIPAMKKPSATSPLGKSDGEAVAGDQAMST